MVEIRRRVDFPRGESGGGNDNDVAAAAASADVDACGFQGLRDS